MAGEQALSIWKRQGSAWVRMATAPTQEKADELIEALGGECCVTPKGEVPKDGAAVYMGEGEEPCEPS